LLLSHNADLNLSDIRGSTALQNAVEARQIKAVETLVRHGADVSVDTWPSLGNILCRFTADGGPAAQKLITLVINAADSAGAVAASADTDGRTALHIAALVGNIEAAAFVVSKVAGMHPELAINRCDCSGYTALDMAERSGHDEILQLLKKHGASFGSQLNAVQRPRAFVHNLRTAGVYGFHPDDPGDLTVANRLEKSLLSSPYTSFIDQSSDAVMLCSVDTRGTGPATLAVNKASRGFLSLVQLKQEQVIGPMEILFDQIGLSRNGQPSDQAQYINRSINAPGPSAVQLLLLKPTTPDDSKEANDRSEPNEARWILWQIWPVRELNPKDTMRRQIHVLWDVSTEALSPNSSSPLDQLSRAVTDTSAAIRGPVQDLFTACLQLGKVTASARLPEKPTGLNAPDAPADDAAESWSFRKELLETSGRGLEARAAHLLIVLPPILRTLAAEARKSWAEPLKQLRHTQAASMARLDLDRVLPAMAWHIERHLKRIEHDLTRRREE